MRVYADTSVFDGVFDAELESASRAFFEQVLFNAVNKANGYSEIAIHSPQEVGAYEEDL